VRINPQAIGHLVTSFPEDDEVLDQFSALVLAGRLRAGTG